MLGTVFFYTQAKEPSWAGWEKMRMDGWMAHLRDWDDGGGGYTGDTGDLRWVEVT